MLTVRIELIFDLADGLWPVWLDKSDMEDAILNMGINAMHAMEHRGQLTIHISNVQLNLLDAKSFVIPPGDYVLFSITDTGTGMDEATKEKIFEPFFTTKGDQGTGLGLSQVYGFVQRSRGAIKIYSELGHGTRIAIYFPRYNESEDKQLQIPEQERLSIKGTETILLVDDEPALLELGRKILEARGFNIICAGNAKEALVVLKDKIIDVLITDIIMPEMDGYQLAAIVKDKYPDVKIQLASGFADDRNMGMVDEDLQKNLLFKPYNSQTLLERLDDIINKKY